MLRTSCLLLIRLCVESGFITQTKKERCEKKILSEETHAKIRNLLMMVLLPKKMHTDDETQGAFLRAAVSRVS